ncbi:MAG: PQQ-like beta-propeller repeat protein [Verrucomicrobia bacterium]|nr:PQQ-like beta-propeller repeat protein [Verrucomicrobiota bacterium]
MVSPETALRHDFAPGTMQPCWEMRKGEGFAAPVVAGDRVVLFHRVGNEEVIDCLEASSGRRFWQSRQPTSYRDRYGYNSGPRASPVIAGDRVITFGAEGRLRCLALADGQVLWQRDLAAEFSLRQNFFGVGASPLVHGHRVIVVLGAPGGPAVAAFHLETGALLWGAETSWGAGYAAPVPHVLHGRERVLIFAGGESKPPTGGLLCLDPEDGRVDFRFPWRGKRYESVNAAAPVVSGSRVLVSECYGSGAALVESEAGGGVRTVWTNPNFGIHFMTALVIGGHVYGVHGHGPQDAELVCVSLATGHEVWRTQPLWRETLPGARGAREITAGTFRSWLVQVDGGVLCLGEFGHLLWLDLSPAGCRILARTWLFAATETWTPPALSRGLIYICQNTPDRDQGTTARLLCYDLRGTD